MSKIKVLRDKTHKKDIEITLEERQHDMNEMVKMYNQSKNIFDQEEIREKQSA